MKNIKKYTLKFINLGKDRKVYLRYFCTVDGIGRTADFPCDIILNRDDVIKLNQGNLGGLIEKELYKKKEQIFQSIHFLALKNNSFPTPEELKQYMHVTNVSIGIEYYINKYKRELKGVKDNTKSTYGYALEHFKRYYEGNLSGYKIPDLITKRIIEGFGEYYVNFRKIVRHKDASKISVYNYKTIIFKFLNYIATDIGVNKVEDYLKKPEEGRKYQITEDDIERLLSYKPKTKQQQEVLDIIKINKQVGLRINELLAIQKDNVSFTTSDNEEVCAIRLIEQKKSKERTVVIVNSEAISIIKEHLAKQYNKKNPNYLFCFLPVTTNFDKVLKLICKKVFKEEQVLIYKNTESLNDYKQYFKWQVISSHAFRRYAIQRNIFHLGLMAATTLSGHTNLNTVRKHYSDWMNQQDLTAKLLGNQRKSS